MRDYSLGYSFLIYLPGTESASISGRALPPGDSLMSYASYDISYSFSSGLNDFASLNVICFGINDLYLVLLFLHTALSSFRQGVRNPCVFTWGIYYPFTLGSMEPRHGLCMFMILFLALPKGILFCRLDSPLLTVRA